MTSVGCSTSVGARTVRPRCSLAMSSPATEPVASRTCQRPARGCDIDHRLEWILGGETKPENLNALCERHHQLKHETCWQYEVADDGDVTWTSPTGHTYTRNATTYPVDTSTRAQLPPDRPAVSPDPDPPPF